MNEKIWSIQNEKFNGCLVQETILSFKSINIGN